MSKLGINPWLSICFKPKKTIATIVRNDPNYGICGLSAICGFLFAFNCSQIFSLSLKMSFWGMLAAIVILAPLLGYIYLSISSAIVWFTGKWVRGKATFKACRSAMAWSYVPLLINVLTWIFLIVVFREKFFTNFPGGEQLHPRQVYFVLMISIIQVVFSIWSLVIFLNSLAEVQGFSLIMAIGNVVIATIVFMLLIGALWLIALSLWVHYL